MDANDIDYQGLTLEQYRHHADCTMLALCALAVNGEIHSVTEDDRKSFEIVAERILPMLEKQGRHDKELAAGITLLEAEREAHAATERRLAALEGELATLKNKDADEVWKAREAQLLTLSGGEP